MTPTEFPDQDGVLGAPANWPMGLGPCSGLPVRRAHGLVISCWRPSWGERLAILLGRPVWLTVASGQSQPAVSLTAAKAIEIQ